MNTKTLSICWGTQQASPTNKPNYQASFHQNYAQTFPGVWVQEQKHGVQGRVISSQTDWQAWIRQVPQGDYLITKESNQWIGVLTADCVPMVLFDPVQEVVAIVHAGWRGTVAKISQIVVQRLREDFGVQPQNLQVYFGPSGQACCYEVDQPFLQPLEQDEIAQQSVLQRSGRTFFDVSLYNVLCLKASGVLECQIDRTANVCTICDLNYGSYRRQNDQMNLQLSMVALR